MAKKFLDAEGVKVLWESIELNDYPNNETLVAILNAIDATKLDKTLVSTSGEKFTIQVSSEGILQTVAEDGTIITPISAEGVEF